jgi:hypothetical protein
VRLNPHEAERRFAELLADAGLPRFAFSSHDAAVDELQLTWAHGLTIHVDLTRDLSPIDDWERAAILRQAPGYAEPEPIHVSIGGSPGIHAPRSRSPASSSTGDLRCIPKTSPRSTAFP